MPEPTGHIEFDLDIPRGPNGQAIYGDSASAYRSGYRSDRTKYGTNIEDNGVAVRVPHELDPAQSEGLLRKWLSSIRNSNNFSGNPLADGAGAVAAAYIETRQGVTYAGIGDALVVAIGEDGRVSILNKLQMASNPDYYHSLPDNFFNVEGDRRSGIKEKHQQTVLNALVPGQAEGRVNDDISFIQREEIERRVGKRFTMLTVTDGLYGYLSSKHEIEAHIASLLHENNIKHTDADFVKRFGEAAEAHPVASRGKPDDLLIIKSNGTPRAGESNINFNLDGMGSYGDGDRVSHRGVKLILADLAENGLYARQSRERNNMPLARGNINSPFVHEKPETVHLSPRDNGSQKTHKNDPWESHPSRENVVHIDVTERIGGVHNAEHLNQQLQEMQSHGVKASVAIKDNKVYVYADASDRFSHKQITNPNGLLDRLYPLKPQAVPYQAIPNEAHPSTHSDHLQAHVNVPMHVLPTESAGHLAIWVPHDQLSPEQHSQLEHHGLTRHKNGITYVDEHNRLASGSNGHKKSHAIYSGTPEQIAVALGKMKIMVPGQIMDRMGVQQQPQQQPQNRHQPSQQQIDAQRAQQGYSKAGHTSEHWMASMQWEVHVGPDGQLRAIAPSDHVTSKQFAALKRHAENLGIALNGMRIRNGSLQAQIANSHQVASLVEAVEKAGGRVNVSRDSSQMLIDSRRDLHVPRAGFTPLPYHEIPLASRLAWRVSFENGQLVARADTSHFSTAQFEYLQREGGGFHTNIQGGRFGSEGRLHAYISDPVEIGRLLNNIPETTPVHVTPEARQRIDSVRRIDIQERQSAFESVHRAAPRNNSPTSKYNNQLNSGLAMFEPHVVAATDAMGRGIRAVVTHSQAAAVSASNNIAARAAQVRQWAIGNGHYDPSRSWYEFGRQMAGRLQAGLSPAGGPQEKLPLPEKPAYEAPPREFTSSMKGRIGQALYEGLDEGLRRRFVDPLLDRMDARRAGRIAITRADMEVALRQSPLFDAIVTDVSETGRGNNRRIHIDFDSSEAHAQSRNVALASVSNKHVNVDVLESRGTRVTLPDGREVIRHTLAPKEMHGGIANMRNRESVDAGLRARINGTNNGSSDANSGSNNSSSGNNSRARFRDLWVEKGMVGVFKNPVLTMQALFAMGKPPSIGGYVSANSEKAVSPRSERGKANEPEAGKNSAKSTSQQRSIGAAVKGSLAGLQSGAGEAIAQQQLRSQQRSVAQQQRLDIVRVQQAEQQVKAAKNGVDKAMAKVQELESKRASLKPDFERSKGQQAANVQREMKATEKELSKAKANEVIAKKALTSAESRLTERHAERDAGRNVSRGKLAVVETRLEATKAQSEASKAEKVAQKAERAPDKEKSGMLRDQAAEKSKQAEAAKEAHKEAAKSLKVSVAAEKAATQERAAQKSVTQATEKLPALVTKAQDAARKAEQKPSFANDIKAQQTAQAVEKAQTKIADKAAEAAKASEKTAAARQQEVAQKEAAQKASQKVAEQTRSQADGAKQAAQQAQKAADQARQISEQAKKSADTARQVADQAKKAADQASKKDSPAMKEAAQKAAADAQKQATESAKRDAAHKQAEVQAKTARDAAQKAEQRAAAAKTNAEIAAKQTDSARQSSQQSRTQADVARSQASQADTAKRDAAARTREQTTRTQASTQAGSRAAGVIGGIAGAYMARDALKGDAVTAGSTAASLTSGTAATIRDGGLGQRAAGALQAVTANSQVAQAIVKRAGFIGAGVMAVPGLVDGFGQMAKGDVKGGAGQIVDTIGHVGVSAGSGWAAATIAVGAAQPFILSASAFTGPFAPLTYGVLTAGTGLVAGIAGSAVGEQVYNGVKWAGGQMISGFQVASDWASQQASAAWDSASKMAGGLWNSATNVVSNWVGGTSAVSASSVQTAQAATTAPPAPTYESARNDDLAAARAAAANSVQERDTRRQAAEAAPSLPLQQVASLQDGTNLSPDAARAPGVASQNAIG